MTLSTRPAPSPATTPPAPKPPWKPSPARPPATPWSRPSTSFSSGTARKLREHLHDFRHPGAGLEVDGLLLTVGGEANDLGVLLDGALVVAEAAVVDLAFAELRLDVDRKSTRLNSSHV